VYHGYTYDGMPSCQTCQSNERVYTIQDVFKDYLTSWEKDLQEAPVATVNLINDVHIQRVQSLNNSAINYYLTASIIQSIHKKPSYLVQVLPYLTNDHPLTEEISNNLQATCDAWILWGKRKGMLWIPAKKGDVIEVIDSHYANSFKVGDRYVVIDTFNGDDTAIVMKTNGEIGTLCFPEEYAVIDSGANIYEKWFEKTVKKFPS